MSAKETAIEACRAALKYDAAIQQAARAGEQWTGGEDLDELYVEWIRLAREALGDTSETMPPGEVGSLRPRQGGGMMDMLLVRWAVGVDLRKPPHVKLFFAWYDLWVGFYWNRDTGTLYFCPLPTICIKIVFSS